MILVADESVDFGLVNMLRQKNIEIISIAEQNSGIKDEGVIQISNQNKCLLITEDKDFGELTYRLKLQHYGVLLIRLSDISRKERLAYAAEIIEKHFTELQNSFSVLTKIGLRIKSLPTEKNE